MSLDNILLGLLREPASGYDLKAIFDERIHHFWAAELSQIYPALQNLERRGLLRSRAAPAKRGAGRRVYQTTVAGHRALREWLERENEASDERSAYVAKLYLMDELKDAGKTLRFFTRLREKMAGKQNALEAIERHWREADTNFPDNLSLATFHVHLALRNGIEMAGARVRWCDECIERIEKRIAKERRNVRAISKPALDAHRGGKPGAAAILDPGARKKGRSAPR